MRGHGIDWALFVSAQVEQAPDGHGLKERLLAVGAVSSLIGARSAIVMTLGLGLYFSVVNAYQIISASDTSGVIGLIGISAIMLAAAFVAFAIHLARRESPLPARWFIPIALLVALAIRMSYYVLIDPPWVSDFARYWRIAVEMANADHYRAVDIYHQRALPFLVPIAELFGKSHEAVKLANIAVLCLVQLLGYDILRRCRGHNAAQCFTVLWIAAPEPLYSSLIPSHDLVAMGQLAAIIWLLTLALESTWGRGRRSTGFVLYAVPIAVLLAALELQRGIGLILLGVLLVTGVASVLIRRRFPDVIAGGVQQPKRLLLIAILILPLYATCMAGISRNGLAMPEQAMTTSMLRYTTAHATSLSDGSYAWMHAFHDTFTKVYVKDHERLSDLRQSLVLSDFVESPIGRAENVVERLDHLYFLGGSLHFYTAGFPKHSPRTMQALLIYNNAFAALFAIFALAGLVNLLTRPRFPLIAGVLLVTIAAITLSLVLLAENQPRYLYVIWFIGSVTIALGLVRLPTSDTPENSRSSTATLLAFGQVAFQAVLAVVIAGAAAWLLLKGTYNATSGQILSHWFLSAHQPSAPSPDARWISDLRNPDSDVLRSVAQRRKPGLKRFGPLALTLQLPHAPAVDDRVEATRKVCSDGGSRNDLAFFVYTPYKNLKRRGAFELEVAVDGHPRWRLALPHADKPTAIEIPDLVPANTCSELAFTLRSKVDIPRESWRRASRVEIYFPRLVDTVR